MTATCRSCGAHIVWCQTRTGKSMPVDALPDPGGNLELQHPNDPRDPPVAHVIGKARFTRDRFMSHFATCPDAAEHRKQTEAPKPIGSIRLPGNTAAARIWNDTVDKKGR